MTRVVFKETLETSAPPARALGPWLATRRILSGTLPGAGAGGGPLIVFDEEAWIAMLSAAFADLRREQVGVLYGEAQRDGAQDWIAVRRAFRARTARGSAVHVALDPRAWEDVNAQAAEAPGCGAVVGWFHTHPDLGAFYSGTDRATQRAAFPRGWQVGLVIDPVRGETAIFAGGESEPVSLRPLVVTRRREPRCELPVPAMILPLAGEAADLGSAAWTALALARNGAAFEPLPDWRAEQRPALVFDRAALKKRFPEGRARLSAAAAGRDGWRVALPVLSADVACVLARGGAFPIDTVLAGSHA